MNNPDYLKVAMEAAESCRKTFSDNFGRPKQVKFKNGNPKDFFTEVDLKLEKTISEKIRKAFPDHKIIGEESNKDEVDKNDLVWIIDPIDGTTNYIHGLPMCCISIALWSSKEPLVGVIYSPALDMLFTAKKGNGAYLNGQRIRVSEQKNLSNAFGGFGWGRDEGAAAKNFPKLIKVVQKMRTLGSTALEMCFVAMGSYDFQFQAQIKIWDFAAAAIIVKEAGGKVTDHFGKSLNLTTTTTLTTNSKLHNQFLPVLKKL